MDSVVDKGRTRLRVSGSLLAVTAALVLTGGVLAACGGSKAAGSQVSAAEGQGGGSGQGGGGGRGGQFPGAFGTLAEIDGSTLQVQNAQSGQVAVTYGSSTTFTESTTTTAAAIKVGDCVSVTGVRTQSSAPASASSSTATRPTSFPAASVEISAPVNGACVATGLGFGGGGGGRGFGGGTRPGGSNAPTDRPSGAPRGQGGGRGGFGGGFGDFATGKVAAATASSLTVVTTARGQQASQTDTISLTSSTIYTENATATAKALKVGLCVFATGKAGTTGAVAATRIALSPATTNGCSTGFGRRPGATSTTGG